MNNEEFSEEKCISVVKRAKDVDIFIDEVSENLLENYEILTIHSLGEEGIDGKERFLAFLCKNSDTAESLEQQAGKLMEAQFGARIHASLEDAFDYSSTHYPAFAQDIEKYEKVSEKIEKIKEKFPPFKASEIEQFEILESLWGNGQVSFVRALFEGEPCMVIVKVTEGYKEVRIRPLAVMMTEDIEEMLEFPDPGNEEG